MKKVRRGLRTEFSKIPINLPDPVPPSRAAGGNVGIFENYKRTECAGLSKGANAVHLLGRGETVRKSEVRPIGRTKQKGRVATMAAYFLSVGLSMAGGVGALSAVGELNNYSVTRMLAQLTVSLAVTVFFGAVAAEIERRWEVELRSRVRKRRRWYDEEIQRLNNSFEILPVKDLNNSFELLPKAHTAAKPDCKERIVQNKRFIKFVL